MSSKNSFALPSTPIRFETIENRLLVGDQQLWFFPLKFAPSTFEVKQLKGEKIYIYIKWKKKGKKGSINRVLLGGTNSVESKSNTWPHLIRPSIRNFSMLHRFRRGYSCVYEFCKHSSIPWRTSGDTCHVSRSEISVYLQECTRIHEELRGRRRECMVVTGHGTARNSLGLERALFRKREKKKVLLMDAS